MWDSEYNLWQNTYFFGPYEKVFGQVDWDITDNLTLTLGGRYTKDEKDFCQASLVTPAKGSKPQRSTTTGSQGGAVRAWNGKRLS